MVRRLANGSRSSCAKPSNEGDGAGMTEVLAGRRILVTRSASQASDLTERLRALGAEPIELATIRIVEPSDGGAALRQALGHLADYEWIVAASPNGARAFAAAATAASIGPADIGSATMLACVGTSTATALTDAGWPVALVPDRFVAEGLLDVMPPGPAEPGGRALLVQAEVSRPALEHGLTERGWSVDRVSAYRTVDADITAADRRRAGAADIVTFTSSSTVERFVRLVGIDAVPATVASIGPITSATARELGVEVTIEASVHTLDGLVDALVDWATGEVGQGG